MKKQQRAERYWRIQGHDGSTEIFDQTFSVGQMTEKNVKELLRALVAKSLSPLEVIGGYAKKRTKLSNCFLDIRKENDIERRRTIYHCGPNPYFVAFVENGSPES